MPVRILCLLLLGCAASSVDVFGSAADTPAADATADTPTADAAADTPAADAAADVGADDATTADGGIVDGGEVDAVGPEVGPDGCPAVPPSVDCVPVEECDVARPILECYPCGPGDILAEDCSDRTCEEDCTLGWADCNACGQDSGGRIAAVVAFNDCDSDTRCGNVPIPLRFIPDCSDGVCFVATDDVEECGDSDDCSLLSIPSPSGTRCSFERIAVSNLALPGDDDDVIALQTELCRQNRECCEEERADFAERAIPFCDGGRCRWRAEE